MRSEESEACRRSRDTLRKLFMLIAVFGILGGCALPSRQLLQTPGLADETAVLWNIRIRQRQVERFSGLLAVRAEKAGLYYVLLDGAGIKLLEARLAADGGREIVSVRAPLRRHRLPEFLADALSRIFLLEPAGEPCGQAWLLRLCREKPAEGQSRKTALAGPITLWSAAYLAGEDDGQWAEVVYAVPWQGATIMLTRYQGLDKK